MCASSQRGPLRAARHECDTAYLVNDNHAPMEQLDSASARRLPSTIEWPTVAVLVAYWAAFAAIIGWHERLPTVVVIAVLAMLGGWFMSMQHEVLHGHPTPWSRLNVAFVAIPLSLWLPYPLYRESHLAHHDSDLTVPGLDPESFYLDQATWDGARGWRRSVYRLHHTLVGRMLFGPAFGPSALLRDEVAALWGNRSRQRIWLVHLAGSAVVCWVVFGVADVPVWQYIIGYCYLGMSLTYLRSYAEHLALAELTRRTAMVVSGRFFGVLFLYNNLHHTHHAVPGEAWYRLPQLSDQLGSESLADNGAGLYRGYGELLRRYAFRPFDTVIAPTDVTGRNPLP